ncbi:Pepco domain-containing protein [Nostoc sp. CALU 1950]|uniref:Pepco domain-containing protein n=1 Tax=Nostoc sp. CALU 1950 TaxID=3104321 RepID=UPI003EBC8477
MSAENSTPKAIWILTEETAQTSSTTSETFINSGERSIKDTGGVLGVETTEEIVVSRKRDEIVITRHKVEVTKLKQEMKGFLQAMREMLDEADQPDSKLQLDEVELSVEVNGEGQISLFGIGGGKAGGKGAMTFKFKRK